MEVSPNRIKRNTAIRVADMLNSIEGVPVSDYAKELSSKWANGEITALQMKQALLAKHKNTI